MSEDGSLTALGYRAESRFSTFDRRWNRLWALLPFLLVAIAFIASMFTAEVDATGRVLVSALTLVVVLWHLWFVTLHPTWVELRPLLMVVYYSGLLIAAFVLTINAESFVLLLTGCFVMAFVVLPGWLAYLGVILTGASLLLSTGDLPPSLAVTAQILGACALAAMIGWAMRRVDSEARRRKLAHADLLEVMTELQRSNEGKDALQQQLSEAARQSGIAEERARLAREFHDTLAQGLAGISSQLETADATLSDSHPASPRVSTALGLSRSSLAEARRSVQALRPGPLSNADLTNALHETARLWRQQYRIPLRLDTTGITEPANDKVKIALLRFTQEGLANVARHSLASQATVTASTVGEQLIIDVFDDGVGIDPERLESEGAQGGFGLTGTRERLRSVGAELNIESDPDAGTTVTAIVPLINVAGELA